MFLLSVPVWVIKVWMKGIYVQLCAAAKPPDAICTVLEHLYIMPVY